MVTLPMPVVVTIGSGESPSERFHRKEVTFLKKAIFTAAVVLGAAAFMLMAQDASKFNGTWKGDNGQVRKLTYKDGVGADAGGFAATLLAIVDVAAVAAASKRCTNSSVRLSEL